MIYLLTGSNEYRIEQEIARFARECGVTPERIDSTQLDRMKLADILRGASLFSAKRLVVIRELSAQKDLWQTLAEWGSTMSDDTLLVLIETKPDRRTKAYKLLAKYAKIIDASSWSERQHDAALQWLQKITRQRQISLTAQQANDMISRATVPSERERTIDQFQLAHAVEALSLLDEVTDEAIATVLPPSVGDVLFEIITFAAHEDQTRVYGALADLRLSEDPHKVFAVLCTEWSRLVAVAVASGEVSQIATDLGVHPFVTKKLRELAALFSTSQLHNLTQLAAELDAGMKRSQFAPWDGVERFVLAITLRNQKPR